MRKHQFAGLALTLLLTSHTVTSWAQQEYRIAETETGTPAGENRPDLPPFSQSNPGHQSDPGQTFADPNVTILPPTGDDASGRSAAVGSSTRTMVPSQPMAGPSPYQGSNAGGWYANGGAATNFSTFGGNYGGGNYGNGNCGNMQSGSLCGPGSIVQECSEGPGFFFRWDLMYFTVSEPAVASIGDPAAAGTFISNGVPFPFANSFDTSFVSDDPQNGDRLEFGLVDPKTKFGWLASVLLLDRTDSVQATGGDYAF